MKNYSPIKAFGLTATVQALPSSISKKQMGSFAGISSSGVNDSRGSLAERGSGPGALTFDDSLRIEEIKEDDEINEESTLATRALERHTRTYSSGISDKMRDCLKSRNSTYQDDVQCRKGYGPRQRRAHCKYSQRSRLLTEQIFNSRSQQERGTQSGP